MSFERLRQSSKPHLARTVGFYLAVVWVVGLFLLLFNFVLAALFIVWFDSSLVDSHVIHDFALSTFIWVLGLAMVVQLYRPERRSTAMQVAVILSIIDLGVSFATGAFEPLTLLLFVPIFLAAALHPARGDVIGFGGISRENINPVLLGLFALAAAPVVLYVAGQLNFQFVLEDEHAAMHHYTLMTYFGLSFLALAGLAALGTHGRRAAAYGAGFMAAMLGAASLAFPAMSALDFTWSVLAILWAVAVVMAVEWSERRDATDRSMAEVADPTS
jgi:hypothetical protein